MRPDPAGERGASLLIAMVVITLMTALVVGAIAFTGTERSAAATQTKAEMASACLQAAKNMFLAQVRLLRPETFEIPMDVSFPVGGEPGRVLRVRTGHYSGSPVTLRSVNKATQQFGTTAVSDLTNRMKGFGEFGGTYDVVATCTDAQAGIEQEIEFSIRVGL